MKKAETLLPLKLFTWDDGKSYRLRMVFNVHHWHGC